MATYRSVDEALRVILKRIPERLSIALDTNLADLEYKYQQATSDWSGNPQFKREVDVKPERITGRIKATGSEASALHFLWTDKGTKPHIIEAKTAPMLRFQVGYSPRTAPVAQSHVGTGQASGAYVSKFRVNHPGTDARQFTKEWVKQQSPVLLSSIKIAIESAVRR